MKIRFGSVVAVAVLLCVTMTGPVYAQTLNWFWTGEGLTASTLVSNSGSGTPTATLIYVPTAISFSAIYVNIFAADTNTADYYDVGIGHCPSNDCSQPNVTIDVVCNWGNSSSGINLSSTGKQSHPCSETTPVTIQPGVYVLLGAGNATVAKCYGQQNSTGIQPFSTTVQGTAMNGSLKNGSFKTSATTGARIESNSCSISLH